MCLLLSVSGVQVVLSERIIPSIDFWDLLTTFKQSHSPAVSFVVFGPSNCTVSSSFVFHVLLLYYFDVQCSTAFKSCYIFLTPRGVVFAGIPPTFIL